MIYFGASGFSYSDWVGNFAPTGMPNRERLSCYAREYNTCEQVHERYDYSYSPSELREGLLKIQKLGTIAEKPFIFTDNHWRRQAVSTIRQLQMMLD